MMFGIDGKGTQVQLIDHMPGAEIAENTLPLLGENVEDTDRRLGQLAGEVAPAPAGLTESAAIEVGHGVKIIERHRSEQQVVGHRAGLARLVRHESE